MKEKKTPRSCGLSCGRRILCPAQMSQRCGIAVRRAARATRLLVYFVGAAASASRSAPGHVQAVKPMRCLRIGNTPVVDHARAPREGSAWAHDSTQGATAQEGHQASRQRFQKMMGWVDGDGAATDDPKQAVEKKRERRRARMRERFEQAQYLREAKVLNNLEASCRSHAIPAAGVAPPDSPALRSSKTRPNPTRVERVGRQSPACTGSWEVSRPHF